MTDSWKDSIWQIYTENVLLANEMTDWKTVHQLIAMRNKWPKAQTSISSVATALSWCLLIEDRHICMSSSQIQNKSFSPNWTLIKILLADTSVWNYRTANLIQKIYFIWIFNKASKISCNEVVLALFFGLVFFLPSQAHWSSKTPWTKKTNPKTPTPQNKQKPREQQPTTKNSQRTKHQNSLEKKYILIKYVSINK